MLLTHLLTLTRGSLHAARLLSRSIKRFREDVRARRAGVHLIRIEPLEERTLLTGGGNSSDVELVSSAATGFDSAWGEVDSQSLSDDGRFLVFESDAPNVVAGQIDNNNVADIFLLDRDTGTVTLISHTGDGFTAGNAGSSQPRMNDDGSAIIFVSSATDLVSGFVNNNGDETDVFSSVGGTVTLISHAHHSTAAGGDAVSFNPAVSDDGNAIVFESHAADLVNGFIDNNGSSQDVFSSVGGTLSLVSHTHDSTTNGGNGRSAAPAISGDGGTVVFLSRATDLVNGFTDNNGNFTADIFSSMAGTLSLVSHTHDSTTAGGNDLSSNPVISGDGSTIAFSSRATNLVNEFTDNNGGSRDVFSSIDGTLSLVSHAHDSTTDGGNSLSFNPVISDGGTIVFESHATDLISGFTDNNGGSRDVFSSIDGTLSLVSHAHDSTTDGGNSLSFNPVISDGGTIVFSSDATNLVNSFTDNNGSFNFNGSFLSIPDIFSSVDGLLSLASHPPGTTTNGANSSSFSPVISGDGSTIAFLSSATDLVGEVLSPGFHGFVVSGGDTTLVDNRFGESGSSANGDSQIHGIEGVSDNGRFVVFESDAPNLVAGQIDQNNNDDVFLLDRNTGAVTLISHIGDGVTAGNAGSFAPVISDDGSTIVFRSNATDLVSGFINNNGDSSDLFSSAAGLLSLVSHTHDSTTSGANASSFNPVVSDDGSTIAFESQATDLVNGFTDNNGEFTSDIFSSVGGTLSLISHTHNSTTNGGNGRHNVPAISGDGNTVVFSSYATDLVSGFTDNNGGSRHVFSSVGGTLSLVSHTHDSTTTGGNGHSSFSPVISSDGSTIVFESYATDLVSGFTENDADSSNIFTSIGGTLALISHTYDSTTTGGNADSLNPVVSSDGSTISFNSVATDLVSEFVDNNGSSSDVFSAVDGTLSLVSHAFDSTTAGANGDSYVPAISGDGGTIAFASVATDLVSGFVDIEDYRSDVFTSVGGTLSLVSSAYDSPTTGANAGSYRPAISGDGSTVVFNSGAANLVANDFNRKSDVLVASILPDLVATALDADIDHVLGAQTTVTFTLKNIGRVPAGAFETQIVWSRNDVVGDTDDVNVAVESFTDLAVGASENRTVTVNLDQAALYAAAVAADVAGNPVGTVSVDTTHLFLVIDANNDVAEINKSNNSGQGPGIDSDDITYFPWDLNGNGTVTPLEALASLQAINTADTAADFDGNGIVTPLEALSVLQRIGYKRNSAVVDDAPAPLVNAIAAPGPMLPAAAAAAASSPTVNASSVSAFSIDEEEQDLFALEPTADQQPTMNVNAEDESGVLDQAFNGVVDWLSIV